MRVFSILFFTVIFWNQSVSQQQRMLFRDTTLQTAVRVNDLLERLTLSEKISLLGYQSQPVSRLGIPAYNWWNEGLHGVARAGNATIFPQAIGIAATFNDELWQECASVISTEARAKFNLSAAQGSYQQYMGLTFWSPNINIARDPRWGRGQETYGEDPYLTASMGVAFVKGIQGPSASRLKAAACAKHFAVHSGPESERHGFNAIVGEADLRETYLYAFKKLVAAGVASVMCAYNRVNDEPCCTGNTLLQRILRKEWNFRGYVVTDCYALKDIYTQHKTLPSSVAVAAAALKAGVNLDCSNLLQDDVENAVAQKLVTPAEIDSSLSPLLNLQIRLGMFDDSAFSPYRTYGIDSIGNSYHRQLARKIAEQSMVLLKNDRNVLPLAKQEYKSIMIVGPNAASLDALIGSYHGVTNEAVDFVEGITKAAGPETRIEYDMGCNYSDTMRFGGIWAAGNASVTIAVLGLTAVYEGEEGDAFLAAGGGDRNTLSLPPSHLAYLKALRKATKTPLILVITAGSAVDIAAVSRYADAVILAWYPGEEGGSALADILYGKVSPSGHLPLTFYNSLNDLPAYRNYSMKGRTYRYFQGPVQYPFGFGLTYTHFHYQWLQSPVLYKDSITCSAIIKNTGSFDADDVVQLYVQYPPIDGLPGKELKAYKRISIEKNGEKVVSFHIPISEIKKWDIAKQSWRIVEGQYQLFIGENSTDQQLVKLLSLH